MSHFLSGAFSSPHFHVKRQSSATLPARQPESWESRDLGEKTYFWISHQKYCAWGKESDRSKKLISTENQIKKTMQTSNSTKLPFSNKHGGWGTAWVNYHVAMVTLPDWNNATGYSQVTSGSACLISLGKVLDLCSDNFKLLFLRHLSVDTQIKLRN